MAQAGPAGLRLQDVARQAGVSHPTILHHFGSRDGLIRALHRHGMQQLRSALLNRMEEQQSSDDGIGRTFAAFRDGLAQRILWLMQAPDLPPGGGVPLTEEIALNLNAVRQHFAPPGTTVDIQDSRAIAHLIGVAAFGDALIGARMRELSGQDETTARTYFENWLSRLIDLHIRNYAPCPSP